MTKTNKHTCMMPLTLEEVALLAWLIIEHQVRQGDVGVDVPESTVSDLSKKVLKALHDAPVAASSGALAKSIPATRHLK